MSRKSATHLPLNSSMAPGDPSSSYTGSLKRARSGNYFDFLSSLPVAVLVTILSLLPIKEMVRTSVLFSNCRDLWKSVPLRLDDSSLHLENPDLRRRSCSNYSRGEDGWLHATISTILLVHKGPIEYCHLSCFDHPILFPTVNGFLQQLSAKNIKHLSISFKRSWWRILGQYTMNSKPDEGYRLAKRAYQLPQTFLQCRTLTKLELLCCCVPEKISQMSIFPNLKELVLRCTFTSDAFMECLFSSHSNLEKLHMHYCCGPKRIQISSDKLIEFVITYNASYPYVNLEEFYIDYAPNLEVLILIDTPTNLVTKKMKMKIRISSKIKKLGMNCSLDDYCLINDV
jgi:hypothetical protein